MGRNAFHGIVYPQQECSLYQRLKPDRLGWASLKITTWFDVTYATDGMILTVGGFIEGISIAVLRKYITIVPPKAEIHAIRVLSLLLQLYSTIFQNATHCSLGNLVAFKSYHIKWLEELKKSENGLLPPALPVSPFILFIDGIIANSKPDLPNLRPATASTIFVCTIRPDGTKPKYSVGRTRCYAVSTDDNYPRERPGDCRRRFKVVPKPLEDSDIMLRQS